MTPIPQTALRAPSENAGLETVGVLNVAQSVLGKRWQFAQLDERLSVGISQAYGLPEIVGRLLVSRGVDFDAVDAFLNPALKSQLPDPYLLMDMEKAATRIADAIQSGEKVAVFGDYDVDGATSSALLARFFRMLGREIDVYIPDRVIEGYGPNAAALLKLREKGATLLITVDCGTTAFDALAAGTKAGLDIVVLDHHRAEPQLPDAFAVVNPNRIDDTSGEGHMAAAGVVFLTIVAVNRILRQRGFYTGTKTEPQIMSLLDLVALGTVCDVVPLTGINRAFVAQGLKVMALRQNCGLAALADVAGLNQPPAAFHAGFMLGPRVNAGGRIGDSNLGAKLLLTDDALEAKDIARQLHQYNAERKTLEAIALEEAIALAEENIADENAVLIVGASGWHPGIIGIVAARLKEKYNRPACVIAFDENDMGKASGRSVSGIDLGAAVISAKQAGLLIAGGGHKMAVGFTVAKDSLLALEEHLNAHVLEQTKGAPIMPLLSIDGVLSAHALTLDLIDKVSQLAPYGAGHAEPRFALARVKLARARVVGENHVSCFIQDTAGGASVKGIAFRALDSALGDLLLKANADGLCLHLAGHASVNEWNGKKSVDFQIVDAALA